MPAVLGTVDDGDAATLVSRSHRSPSVSATTTDQLSPRHPSSIMARAKRHADTEPDKKRKK